MFCVTRLHFDRKWLMRPPVLEATCTMIYHRLVPCLPVSAWHLIPTTWTFPQSPHGQQTTIPSYDHLEVSGSSFAALSNKFIFPVHFNVINHKKSIVIQLPIHLVIQPSSSLLHSIEIVMRRISIIKSGGYVCVIT